MPRRAGSGSNVNSCQRGKRVLVVDDEPVIRELFKQVLGAAGYKVVTAENSVSAVRAAKAARFDLVFLDIRLGDGFASEVFPKLKQCQPDIPICIITGYMKATDHERVLDHNHLIRMGATDRCLRKPFNNEDLLKTTRELIRNDAKKESWLMMPGRILVVDDELVIRELFEEVLGAAGYEVTTAGDGASALEAVKTTPFNLVYLDIRLPDCKASELLPKLMTHQADTPVCIVTGYDGGVDRDHWQEHMKLVRLGAKGRFLRKPFDTEELLTMTQELEKRRSLVVTSHRRKSKRSD